MTRFLTLVLAAMLALAAAPASAKEHVNLPGAKKIEIPFKELPRPVVRNLAAQLSEMGIEADPEMTMAADTSACPSDCNDSTGGGWCYCQPDGNGDCPGNSEKAGSPGQEYCRVARPKSEVMGGGMNDPVEVVTPGF